MVRVRQYSAYNLHRCRDGIYLNQDSDTSITESQMFSTAQYSWRIDWVTTASKPRFHLHNWGIQCAHYVDDFYHMHIITMQLLGIWSSVHLICQENVWCSANRNLSEKVICIFAGYTSKIIILFTTFQVPERHNNYCSIKAMTFVYKSKYAHNS